MRKIHELTESLQCFWSRYRQILSEGFIEILFSCWERCSSRFCLVHAEIDFLYFTILFISWFFYTSSEASQCFIPSLWVFSWLSSMVRDDFTTLPSFLFSDRLGVNYKLRFTDETWDFNMVYSNQELFKNFQNRIDRNVSFLIEVF